MSKGKEPIVAPPQRGVLPTPPIGETGQLRRGPRRGSTSEKVARIVAKNPRLTLECIGLRVGVSRERVRQIVQRDGLTRVDQQEARRRHLLEWPCPNCGAPCKTWSGGALNRRKTVYCNRCATTNDVGKEPKPYCVNGHARTPENLYSGHCRPCQRAAQVLTVAKAREKYTACNLCGVSLTDENRHKHNPRRCTPCQKAKQQEYNANRRPEASHAG